MSYHHAMITHFEWEWLLVVPFLFGIFVFALMRAGMAIRSTVNPIKTRKEYFYHNWDMMLVRTVLVLPIFWLDQNADTVSSVVHHQLPFKIPDGILAVLILGFFSNAILDWFSGLQTVPFTKWPIPSVIKDNIPLFPADGVKAEAQHGEERH